MTTTIKATELAKQEFKRLESIKTKVFYDFETAFFSRPFSLYQKNKQIVMQVSVIKQGEHNSVTNLIFDPQNFDPIVTCKNIIDAVHVEGDGVGYFVYTTFEHGCWEEMTSILSHDIEKDKYLSKIDDIIRQVEDLATWFKMTDMPKIIIPQLGKKWNLKLVSEHIPQDISAQHQFIKYEDLACNDGRQAQKLLNLRAVSKNEEDWEISKFHLLKYCENDVRAMIALYGWIKLLVGI